MSRCRKQERLAKKRREDARRTRLGQATTASTEAAVATIYDDFVQYAESADSRETAAAAARSNLRAAVDKIVHLTRGVDPIKVLSSVHVAMIMQRHRGDDEPPAAALEVIALVLFSSATADPEGVGTRPAVDFMPPRIFDVARRAVAAGSMIGLFESLSSDAESRVVFYSVQREINLRNPVYSHMLLDTLRGLFGSPAVSEDCREVLGFTGLEAVEVMSAAASTVITALASRFKRMEEARDASLPHLKAWRARGRGTTAPLDDEHRAAALRVYDAVQGLTTNIDQAMVVDAELVARHADVSRSVVDAVFNAFSLGELGDVDKVLDRFFKGDNVLRTAPLVSDDRGRRMLVHDALALPAVREVIETRLKAAGRHSAYEHHRGDWVERAAIDLLAGVFSESTVYRGFNYFIPDPRAATPQVQPENFTKRVEADGLILVDDVALIIEVKSVALTAEARGGVARRLRGKLRDIVTAAANQAGRLRERIMQDKRIRLDDGGWIDVSGVREVHTIAVGLEDLSGVTTATSTLIEAGVLKEDNVPWTVSVHDLRAVCELVERPSELLLYLRRRTHLKATWKYRAIDELDLFLHFQERGLYVEPDPFEAAEALPWAGPPPEDDLRRFYDQRPEVVPSRTGPLDAWYHSQLDPAAPAAPKPRFIADRVLLRLVDQLAARGEPGWLSAATWLLEGDGEVQRTFGRIAKDLGKLVRRDQQHHSMSHLMGENSGNHVLLVWACLAPRDDLKAAASSLGEYLAAKKHQTGAYRAACMIFNPTGKKLLRLIYDNRLIGMDAELDAAAEQLVPLEEMQKAKPKSIRPSSASS